MKSNLKTMRMVSVSSVPFLAMFLGSFIVMGSVMATRTSATVLEDPIEVTEEYPENTCDSSYIDNPSYGYDGDWDTYTQVNWCENSAWATILEIIETYQLSGEVTDIKWRNKFENSGGYQARNIFLAWNVNTGEWERVITYEGFSGIKDEQFNLDLTKFLDTSNQVKVKIHTWAKWSGGSWSRFYEDQLIYQVSGDTTATYDASGKWTVSFHLDWASGNCPSNGDVTATYTITQTGDSVQITNPRGATMTGTVSNATYTASYSSTSVEATMTFTLSSSTSGSGTYTDYATWGGGSYSCDESWSITMTKQPDQSNGGDGGDDGGGAFNVGCFIATATYGSPMAKKVLVLRNFRDNVLLQTSVGKSFMKFYYETSPPLADYIGEHETLRTASRLTLMPAVYGVKYPKISVLIFLSSILAITLTLRMRRANKF